MEWSALNASGVTRDMTRYLGRGGYVNRYHGILRDVKIIISSGKTSGRHINVPSSSDRIVQLHKLTWSVNLPITVGVKEFMGC